jgi:hypothetical protein
MILSLSIIPFSALHHCQFLNFDFGSYLGFFILNSISIVFCRRRLMRASTKGKYTLGYKIVLKSLRSSKGFIFIFELLWIDFFFGGIKWLVIVFYFKFLDFSVNALRGIFCLRKKFGYLFEQNAHILFEHKPTLS